MVVVVELVVVVDVAAIEVVVAAVESSAAVEPFTVGVSPAHAAARSVIASGSSRRFALTRASLLRHLSAGVSNLTRQRMARASPYKRGSLHHAMQYLEVMSSGGRNALVAISLVAVAAVGFFFWLQRGEVRVLSVDRPEPGLVQLGVASCQAEHDVVVSDLIDGRYSVAVERTSRGLRGADCADIVEIAVDPTLQSFEIEDLVSGDVFPWPTTEPPPPPVTIDGRWQMTHVNGERVEVGVNTQSIPEFEIEAGFLSGNFGCNGGGGELLLDGTQLRGVVGGDEELCTVPGSDDLVPTERVLLEMLNSDEGAMVTVNADSMMIWRRGGDELIFEMV